MMKQQIFSTGIKLFLLILFTSTSNAFACDNKSCENNYLVSTHKIINQSVHQATITKREKAEYSANYKRQQIALVNVRRAHALNESRKRYAVERRYQLRKNKISVLNEHRAHALNRTRKLYALTHLKQRRQMLLHAKKLKVQPLNTLVENSLKSNYKRVDRNSPSTIMSRTIASINAENEKEMYYVLAKSSLKSNDKRVDKNSRSTIMRRTIASINASNSFKRQRHQKVTKVKKHHKRKNRSLVKFKTQRQRQRLANLKLRRADTIEREKKIYARNKQRRHLLKLSKRMKEEKRFQSKEEDS